MPQEGTIYQVNNEIKVLADIKSEGVDKTGAHDVFVASVAYGLTKKYDMDVTLRLATIASSLTKNKIGATLSIPLLSEVISIYESKFGKLNNPQTLNISNETSQESSPNNVETPK